MNDTGGGVTAIHDVPGDITRIGFHWMLFFSFLSLEGGFYLFFTRSVSEVTGFFFVPRLVLGPTDQREVICELSNCFLHTDCRGWLWGLLFMRMGAIRRCL